LRISHLPVKVDEFGGGGAAMAGRYTGPAPDKLVEAARKDTNFIVLGCVALVVTFFSVVLPASDSIQKDWRRLKTAEAVSNKLRCEGQARSRIHKADSKASSHAPTTKSEKPAAQEVCDEILRRLLPVEKVAAGVNNAPPLRSPLPRRKTEGSARSTEPDPVDLFKSGPQTVYRMVEAAGTGASGRTVTLEEAVTTEQKFAKAQTQLRNRLRERTDLSLLGFTLKLPFTLVAAAWLGALAVLAAFLGNRRRRFYRELAKFVGLENGVYRARARGSDLATWLAPLPWLRAEVAAATEAFHPSAMGVVQRVVPAAALGAMALLAVFIGAIGMHATYASMASEADGVFGVVKAGFKDHRLEVISTLLGISVAAAALCHSATASFSDASPVKPLRRVFLIAGAAAAAAAAMPFRWFADDARMVRIASEGTNRYRRRAAASLVVSHSSYTVLQSLQKPGSGKGREGRLHVVAPAMSRGPDSLKHTRLLRISGVKTTPQAAGRRRTPSIPQVGKWTVFDVSRPLEPKAKPPKYASATAANGLELVALGMISSDHLDTELLAKAAKFLLANIPRAPTRTRPRLYDLASGLAVRARQPDLLEGLARQRGAGVGGRAEKWRGAATLLRGKAPVGPPEGAGANWLRKWSHPKRLPWRRSRPPRARGVATLTVPA
jgi:hypothetical protein